MVFRMVSKRIICISDMITQFNYASLPPSVCGKSLAIQIPCFTSLRTRSFCCSGPVRYMKASITESTQTSTSLNVHRVSRAKRSDAQAALFDYLHCTRGFPFTDAEHISKNSPHFVENLLSKVEDEEDVSRALTRFFRYHPINEFEPFFESLGLTPSELNLRLPRDLMFLSDDQALLDNFHVLYAYGVPRIKIGKMFKEANVIFRSDSGILTSSLRAYEHVGLSKSNVIKMVTCCPTLLVGGVNKECTSVLEKLKGFGLGNDWIGGYLSDKNTYSWNRILETLNFLVEVGYSDAQMGTLFKANPALLFEGSGKNIYVLVGRFFKLGIKRNTVYSLSVENPEILSPKCFKNLWKAVDFLFEIGMDTKDIANIVCTHLRLLGSHSLFGPKTVLRKFKGDKFALCQTIKQDYLKFFSLASKSNNMQGDPLGSQNPVKYLERTTFLLKLGYVENSEEMAMALKRFRGRGDQLQERFDCLVKAGLDFNVVSNMVRQAPSVVNQSKDMLEKKIDYLRNCLHYPLESIVVCPTCLCYDLRRINLRCKMYAWLRDRDAVRLTSSLSTLLACSDARFVKYFVDKHPEGPAMWENLKKSLLSS